ncbi:MAG: L,D-transpeptidase catalytic domain [Syntrophus sp. PtaU1.Bin005]|nr:MAG: L,D-transpeptidase catalytic domain [Syntrophus sp. PtaB.Bin138]OPY80706.1 MAG: L,D-transpeptidase catalytic domain [Syntrophus sp. PtaU1.Bin005]
MLNCKRTGCMALYAVAVWLCVMVSGCGCEAAVTGPQEGALYEEFGVERVLSTIGPRAEARIKPFFDRTGVPYPSFRLSFVVVKEEMVLEVWAENEGKWTHVRDYEILAASGWHGPKLRRGDRQVPEGIYQIIALNPASQFHLSMKINYPNDYDLQRARDENRSNLGGDIFIHGKDKSHGCLAVGDTAIEELFVLVAKTGPNNVNVIITPHDMRKYGPNPGRVSDPSWVPDLYNTIWRELSKFKTRQGA